MTFRAKPVVKRAQRPSLDSRDRRNFYLNVGFGLVVVAAVLILVAAAGATYYNDHFASVASVNGQSINKDQLRDRATVEALRIELLERRIEAEIASGHLAQSVADQQTQYLEQRKQSITDIALQALIDYKVQSALAAQEGITVTDQDVDAQLVTEATTPEERHAWVIEVKPTTPDGATAPTDADKAAAKAKADQALQDLAGGRAWEDVAKAVSTGTSAQQGGDLGWVAKDTTSLDQAFHDALFGLAANAHTDVILGSDGIYRIGRVTDIAPASVDPSYQQEITNDNVYKVTLASYRDAVRSDLVRKKLSDKVVADAIKPSVQRRVQELFIAAPQSDPGTGAVKVRHILYSPKDDPNGASKLPASDPAWTAAQNEAQATYEKLKADISQFDAIARKDSDESGARGATGTGGKLPYYDPTSPIDPAFAAAIFKPGLQPGQLLEPVKSAFGWHVIQILYYPPDLDEAKKLKAQAQAGTDFSSLVRDYGESGSSASLDSSGWVAKGQLSTDLETPIFAAKVGDVTDPISSSDGIHLFKVLEEATRAPEGTQLDSIKSSAFDTWYAEKEKAFDIQSSSGTATQ